MRIQVKSETQNLRIVLPTALVFSRGTAWLANHFGRKYASEAMSSLSPEKLDALFSEIRHLKHKYGSLDLVEVDAADGEYVKITL